MNDCLKERKESKSTGEKIDYPNKFNLIKQSKFGSQILTTASQVKSHRTYPPLHLRIKTPYQKRKSLSTIIKPNV